jgi:hypothetical protein
VSPTSMILPIQYQKEIIILLTSKLTYKTQISDLQIILCANLSKYN